MSDRIFFYGLLFIPIVIIAHYGGVAPTTVFFLAAIAIIPLAKFIGEATEVLSSHTNPGLGGLLNATFGNATELIISIFAIQAGLLEIVKASITGSIIGNLLFVLGTAMLVGGTRHKKQEFNKTAAMASASMLLLAVAALVVPAIFAVTVPQTAGNIVEQLSVLVSLCILIVYGGNLWFMLYTHKHLYTDEAAHIEAPRWSIRRSLFILLLSTTTVAWMSEILVSAIRPAMATLGWTELFIGVIVVAMVGNAAEHSSAITMAAKNRMDLAIQISIGSAAQIAMFVAPLLVLISLFMHNPMSLVFNEFELIAIILSVFMSNIVVQDGESNWLEGFQLLSAYAIMAAAFFLHP